MNLSPLRSTVTRLSSLNQPRSSGVDSSLLPYIPKVIEEEKQKQSQFQPLQFVLDLLSRGQYLTANVADEIEQSARTGKPLGEATINTLKAAFQGLTGQRKGDWETLLFGGNIEGGGQREGWLPDSIKNNDVINEPLIRWGKEGSTGLAEGMFRPRKVMGLAANIAGDPLTWLTMGGTEAARAVATKYAQDVVKLTVATMDAEKLAKLGAKAGGGVEQTLKVIQKSGDIKMKRMLENTYNEAYKNALRNPQAKIMEDVAPQLEVAGQRAADNPGLQGLVSSMQNPSAYAQAGERGFGFLGKEFGKSVRQPWLPTRAWDTITARFANRSPGESKLADAWYAIMNTGPVGQIKKSLGIRNPYEQMLNLTKRRISDHGEEFFAQQETAKYHEIFKGADEEVINKTRDAFMSAEKMASKIPVEQIGMQHDVSQKILDPIFQASIDLKPEEINKVKDLIGKIQQVTHAEFEAEKVAAEAAGVPFDAIERLNYFPQKVGKGEMAGSQMGAAGRTPSTGPSGFTKSKKMAVEDHVTNNAEMLKFLMGPQLKSAYEESGKTIPFDDFVKNFVKEKNLSDTTLNLQEAFTMRGIDHAKTMARYNMIEEFKHFGVPIKDVEAAAPQILGSLNTWGEGMKGTGLYKVTTPGFEGLLFDAPTAEIITHAGDVLNGSKGILRYLDSMTGIWKGFTTMTPGFHFRNLISNNVIGFLKFGPAWLDMRKDAQALVGTVYAMHPDKFMDVLTGEFKMSTGVIAATLNKRVNGDFTIKELADYMRQAGTLSSKTQIAQEGLKQKIFKPSRTAGDFIENSSKFKSFLIDYERMAGDLGQSGGELAGRLANQKQYLEYADMQTKKWFLDYGDLTPFEQNVMKRLIPFYTWVRKNLANQLTGIITMPQTYELIPKVRNALTTDEGFNYGLMPDYMKNQGYYPVGKTPQGTDIMRWANLPLEDLNKIPLLFNKNGIPKPSWSETLTDVMSNAHPLLKTIVEMASGKDLFRKKDIANYEAASPVLQYLSNSPRLITLLDGLMRTAGFENGIRIKKSSQGNELQIDGKVERVLENNVPALRTLDLLLSTPETLAEQFDPAVEAWIEKTFGKKDYYTGLEELFQVVSRVGGWKFKEVSQDEQAKNKEAELRARLSKLKSADEKDRLAYAARIAKSRRSSEVRNRRMFGSYTR
jgi:hypothetical protein